MDSLRMFLMLSGRYDPNIYDDEGNVHEELWPEKHKRFYALALRVNQMKTAMKRHDLPSLRRSFRKTNKQLAEKVMSQIPAGKVPTLYIKALVRLENYFSTNKSNTNLDAEACSSLEQKVERNNTKYEDAIAKERENPAESDDEWDIEELDEAPDYKGPQRRKIRQTDRLMDWRFKADVSVDNTMSESSSSSSSDSEDEDDGQTDSDMDYLSDLDPVLQGIDVKALREMVWNDGYAGNEEEDEYES